MKFENRASFGWGKTAASYALCKNGLVVHYDGSNQGLADKSHEACRTYWKNTRVYHMKTKKWADIGYSFGVCPHGSVFEGRGWQRQQAAQPGGNTTWTSCTFMSGPAEKPTSAQVEAFKELRKWLRGKGLASAIKGHRNFVGTSCPGGILYEMVQSGALAGAPVPEPEPPAPTPPPTPAPTPVPSWTEKAVKSLPTLSRGASGDAVGRMQHLLLAAGVKLPRYGADEDFGGETDSAVRLFQRDKGLSVDGVVGQGTWQKLLGV